MAHWWERNLDGLPADVARERRRVLLLLESHAADMGPLGVRLMNLIANGLDLEEDMQLPIDERATGFNWPDE